METTRRAWPAPLIPAPSRLVIACISRARPPAWRSTRCVRRTAAHDDERGPQARAFVSSSRRPAGRLPPPPSDHDRAAIQNGR
jgi:hypothetical protein